MSFLSQAQWKGLMLGLVEGVFFVFHCWSFTGVCVRGFKCCFRPFVMFKGDVLIYTRKP